MQEGYIVGGKLLQLIQNKRKRGQENSVRETPETISRAPSTISLRIPRTDFLRSCVDKSTWIRCCI